MFCPQERWWHAVQAEDVRAALAKGDPRAALERLVRRAVERDGMSNADALAALEDERARLRSAADEPAEDIVMDVMDLLVGFCRPGAAIPRRK